MVNLFDRQAKPVVTDKTPSKPQPKLVNVIVAFEMDERTAKLFLQSSIERVINASRDMIEKIDATPGSQNDYPHSSVNLEDWVEWKPVICTMWNAMHDAIFRVQAELPPNERVFTLHKGDL